MNWFQFVFLREDSQVPHPHKKVIHSCELISICIFTWGFTSNTHTGAPSRLLWIDFNLYFYVRIHKQAERMNEQPAVVNWFQFVFLREDSQVNSFTAFTSIGCELISNCIFTWGFTRDSLQALKGYALWIDFKLYFYVRIHKQATLPCLRLGVVNWFQIVFLREDSQACKPIAQRQVGCELISNCIFTWGFTRLYGKTNSWPLLWIDFNLYFYVRIHKLLLSGLLLCIVVNWFQFVFLREDSQGFFFRYNINYSCELISICIFTWGFTSRVFKRTLKG